MFSHVVMKGQSLSRIAEMYNVSIDMILAVNPNITDPDCIFIGQVIQIPFVGGQCWSYPGMYMGMEQMGYLQHPGAEMGYPQLPGAGMGYPQVAGAGMGYPAYPGGAEYHGMPTMMEPHMYPMAHPGVYGGSTQNVTGMPGAGTPMFNLSPNTQVNPYAPFNPYTEVSPHTEINPKTNFEFNPKTQLQFNPHLDFDLNIGGGKK